MADCAAPDFVFVRSIDLFGNIPSKPSGAFRVLHTADWHLGKPLGDLSRGEEHAAFLDFLLGAIQDFGVDALIVAGDVFDSAHPPQSAIRQYFDFISALYGDTTCTMIVTGGNHDSPSHLEAPRELLSALRVHVVGQMPDKVEQTLIPLPNAENPALIVAAIPFLRDRDLRTGKSGESAAAIQEQLVAGIAKIYARAGKAAKTWKNERGAAFLATGHLTAGGSLTCPQAEGGSEREIHVGGLGTIDAARFPTGIDYLALGHLHRPQNVAGVEHFRYSGSPLPLSFAEAADEKEVRILDFAEGRLAGNHRAPLPLPRRLIQWRLQRDELAFYLREKKPPKSPLTPWVEVIVEDPRPGENLYEAVRELAVGRPYEVVRVVGQRLPNSGQFVLGEFRDERDADDLMADPTRIFECRLAEAEGYDEAERDALRTAFAELLELGGESEKSARRAQISNTRGLPC